MVLDTNVLSELMRTTPDARVVAWARDVPPALVFTTSISVAEVRFGVARLPLRRRRDRLNEAADEVFGAFADHVLAFDAAAATEYADVVVAREQSGAPIGGFDAQIAAICRVHRASLATRNVDDFGALGLTLIDPWGIDPWAATNV